MIHFVSTTFFVFSLAGAQFRQKSFPSIDITKTRGRPYFVAMWLLYSQKNPGDSLLILVLGSISSFGSFDSMLLDERKII